MFVLEPGKKSVCQGDVVEKGLICGTDAKNINFAYQTKSISDTDPEAFQRIWRR
jgi:hypothetical protein